MNLVKMGKMGGNHVQIKDLLLIENEKITEASQWKRSPETLLWLV